MANQFSTASGTSAPDLVTRFAAALIDGFIAALLSILFAAAPLISGLLSGGYLVLRDGFEAGPLHYRSVGKYVMGLGLLRVDGGSMNLEASVRRNWMFGLGAVAAVLGVLPLIGGLIATLLSLAGFALFVFEVYNVVTDPAGLRWGDRLGGTKVITAGEGIL